MFTSVIQIHVNQEKSGCNGLNNHWRLYQVYGALFTVNISVPMLYTIPVWSQNINLIDQTM